MTSERMDLNFLKDIEVSKRHRSSPKRKRVKTTKHFPSPTRYSRNSVYTYNKNGVNTLPVTDDKAKNVIRSYFGLFNDNLENKTRRKQYKSRFRKTSQNKIFMSGLELKHTNNKVVININIFNRQKNNYNLAISKLKTFIFQNLENSSKIFSERLNFIETKSFKLLKQNRLKLLRKKKLFLIKNFNERAFSKTSKYINMCIKNFFFKLLKKEHDKTLQYFYYKQMAYINRHKHTYLYLQHLKENIYKIYNKQVEFNLISLRRFYLNSDILSESILKKINKNRKKVLTYIKKLGDKVLVLRKRNIPYNYKVKMFDKKAVLSEYPRILVNTILNNTKYKDVTGFKFQAKGRLTKRYTASRSVLKVVHKGNLLNKDSSFLGLSSVFLKGNLKSNLQYTSLASKSRIGSYGLKS
jgi:hypothetical protein